MSTRRSCIVAPLLLLVLSGCGTGGGPVAPSASGAPDAEQALIATELAAHPELIEDGLFESGDQAVVGPARSRLAAGVAAPIQPLFFWRDIRHVERTHEFAFADTDSTGRPTTAIVTIHKRLSGTFNVVARDTSPDGALDDGRRVQKPLRDHWTRRLRLERVQRHSSDNPDDPQGDSEDSDDSHHRRWRVVATSAVQVTSRDAATRIQSLRIQGGALDTTLSDPLALFRLRRLLRFDPETEVTLTVTTLRDDDIVVLYRHGLRSRFHNNGDNTYSATWTTSARDGLRHFGVNALAHGTLFDDEAPYDSQSWVLPYVVAPVPLAGLVP